MRVNGSKMSGTSIIKARGFRSDKRRRLGEKIRSICAARFASSRASSDHLFVYFYLFIYLFICLFVCLFVYLFFFKFIIHLFIHSFIFFLCIYSLLFIYLSTYPVTHLLYAFISRSIYIFTHLSLLHLFTIASLLCSFDDYYRHY